MGALSDIKKLWEVAGAFQDATSAIKQLEPVRWLETDEVRLKEISRKITERRLEQRRVLAERNVATLLERLENYSSDQLDIPKLSERDKALVTAMRRYCNAILPLSENDIKAMDQVTAQSETEWMETFGIAEKEGNQAAFQEQAKTLRTVFGLRRSLSRKVVQGTGLAASEVPLDEFNPWMTNSDVDELFAPALALWPSLISKLKADTHNKPTPVNPFAQPAVKAKFSPEKQLDFFIKIRNAMLESAGWTDEELKKHRITVHKPKFLPNPFCSGTREEVWMTIENRNGNFLIGLDNTMHETGHLLYLLSLNRLDPQLQDTPLGQFNGLGLHETAALFYEQVATNEKFWELVAPMIRDHFDVAGPEWSASNLRAIMNDPALDQTFWGASEVALMPNMYFRSVAERRIMDGLLEVKELPGFWAQTMESLTGIAHTPEEFFVDESHWFDRYTGYFPAYWIGGLCGARVHELTDKEATAQAETLTSYLRPFYETLNDKILRHGSKDKPLDLMQRELGGRPSDFLEAYLKRMAASYLGQAGPDFVSNLLASSSSAPKPADPDRPRRDL